MELIDKAAVIAEIKKRIKYYQAKNQKWGVAGYEGRVTEGEEILDYINTLEVKEIDLENYISNKLRELGADLINHKPYSFNRGLNVGKTNAYHDILDRLIARKEEVK